MAGPEGEIAAGAGSCGYLRASHADREQAIESLKAAFVQGRLAKGEFDLRVGQVLAARTYAELAAATTGIPAGLTTSKPPAPAGARGRQPVVRPGRVALAATVLYAGVWVYAILFPKGGDNDTYGELFFFGGLVYLMILALCVGRMAALRQEEHTGGKSPRRPAAGAGGQAPQRLPSVGPDRQLPPARDNPRRTAEAAPSRRRHTPLPRWRAQVFMPGVR